MERILKSKEEQQKEFFRYWIGNLGFNFLNKITGQVISKRSYFERFGDSYQDEWELIPFEPIGGYRSAEDKRDHFLEVAGVVESLRDEILTL